jgi:hypothetical protein
MTRAMPWVNGFCIKNIKKKIKIFLQSYTQESWVWLQRLTEE